MFTQKISKNLMHIIILQALYISMLMSVFNRVFQHNKGIMESQQQRFYNVIYGQNAGSLNLYFQVISFACMRSSFFNFKYYICYQLSTIIETIIKPHKKVISSISLNITETIKSDREAEYLIVIN